MSVNSLLRMRLRVLAQIIHHRTRARSEVFNFGQTADQSSDYFATTSAVRSDSAGMFGFPWARKDTSPEDVECMGGLHADEDPGRFAPTVRWHRPARFIGWIFLGG
jgi:hypothetical protein